MADKSLSPVQAMQKVLQDKVFDSYWVKWFQQIFELLGFSNCRLMSFTPDTTGFTYGGTTTTTANYSLFRNDFKFSVDIEDSVSITIAAGATLNVKAFGNPVTPLSDGYCVVSNTQTNLMVAQGVINDGIAYFPAIAIVAAPSSINISGFYLIEETK